MGATTARNRTKSPLRHPGGPEIRAEAMRRLAEGWQLSSVARELGVRRQTVRDWRDSPQGQALLAEARRVREATFKDAAEEARRILREAGPLAAQRLVDALAASPPHSVVAAREILGRIGVLHVEGVEQRDVGAYDLSKLTDEELAELERIQAKARTKADA